MPCDQIRTTVVEIGKMDAALLVAALKALGYTVSQQGAAILFADEGSYRTHRYENGRLTYQGSLYNESERTNNIKQAYSAEVVKQTAARFGWNLKQSATNKFAFTATRRG